MFSVSLSLISAVISGKKRRWVLGSRLRKDKLSFRLMWIYRIPPELIPAMVAKWCEGYEAFANRCVRRDADSWFKRISARWLYRVHNIFADQKFPEILMISGWWAVAWWTPWMHCPNPARFMKGFSPGLAFEWPALIMRPRPSGGEANLMPGNCGISPWTASPASVPCLYGFGIYGICTGFDGFRVCRSDLFACSHFRNRRTGLRVTDGAIIFSADYGWPASAFSGNTWQKPYWIQARVHFFIKKNI